MARVNQICKHPQRAEIDRAILSGTSYRDIAEQFGIKSASTIERYVQRGCPGGDLSPKEAVRQKVAEKTEARALDGLAILSEALKDLDSIQRRASEAGQFSAAASAARGKIEIAKTVGVRSGGGGDGSALAGALEKLGDGAWAGVVTEVVENG